MYKYEGLHVLEVLRTHEIELWLRNDRIPENRRMIEYWIKAVNDKAAESLAMWDDVVFLYAIEMQRFLKEVEDRWKL